MATCWPWAVAKAWSSLVDTVRGTVKTRLTSPSQEDEGDVRSLAFSPLGDELAVGTQRGTIRLWQVRSNLTPLVRLPGHRGTVTTLAYDAGGRRLASGSQDKTVVVWDMKLVRDELAKLRPGLVVVGLVQALNHEPIITT